jgi:hypothetical protein
LQTLTLVGAPLDDDAADSIRKMKQLKWLSVEGCAVGDATLPAGTISGMSDEPKKQVWPWIVALLIGLPVMYVLSVGPMTRLVVHYPVPAWVRHAYRRVYALLVWVTQRSKTANYVYGINLLLWNDLEELFPPPASAAAPPIPASTTAPTAPSPPDSN